MQNNKDYSSILENVYTRQDLDELESELTVLKESLYRGGEVAAGVSKSLVDLFLTAPDKETLLTEIGQFLASLKTLKLTVAVSPTAKLVKNVSLWARQSLVPNLILEFDVNREVVGGAIIEWEGKYLDLSLAKRLEEALNGKL